MSLQKLKTRYREFKKEQGQCAKCGITHNLTIHHLLGQKEYPEIKHFKMNFVCLCRECHDWIESDFEGLLWETEQFHVIKQELLAFMANYRRLRNGSPIVSQSP